MNVKNLEAKSCILCGASVRWLEDTIRVANKPIRYAVCLQCELIQKTQTTPSLKEEKTQYDYHDNSFENSGYVDYLNRFATEAVDPFIKAGKGLEFGSGPGPVLFALLKKRGFDMRHYDPFYHPEQSVFKTTYDLITSTEVFEHFQNPLKEIKRLISLLKPGGILAVMTCFHPKNDAVFLKWWYRRDITHLVFYTENTFKYLTTLYPITIVYSNHKNIIVFKKEV